MITISDIEGIENKIKVAKNRSSQYCNIIDDTSLVSEDFNSSDVTIPEFLTFMKDSNTIKSILSNPDTPESLRHSLTIITKKIPELTVLIDTAVSDAQDVLSTIQNDVNKLKIELDVAIKQYCYENDFHLDYYIKIGTPFNPNGSIYTAEELESVVSEIVTLIKNNSIDVHVGERNKIFLPSIQLTKENAVDFIFNLIKDNDIVISKFNGIQFKTCLQVNNYTINSSHEVKLFQK
jgi:hypothetical protein